MSDHPTPSQPAASQPAAAAPFLDADFLGEVSWDADGLIPAIAQDAATGDILMVAWMNREAYDKTVSTGRAHFWSRSRQVLWEKGATSGNTQQVVGIQADCDGDTLLVQVKPAGPACHTGAKSCFFESDHTSDSRW